MSTDRPRRITFLQACNALNIYEAISQDSVHDSEPDDAEPDLQEDLSINSGSEQVILDSVTFPVDDEGDLTVQVENISDSDDNSESDNNDTDDFSSDLQNPKGIVYSKTPYQHRIRERDILRERPTTVIQPTSVTESFSLIFTSEILYHILRCTNIKVRSLNSSPYPRNKGVFTIDELKACIGVLLRAGADRDNFTDIDDLWKVSDSKPFYRATISKSRFKFFLVVVRFDDFRTREARKSGDTLAAFSEVWELLNVQFIKFYVPKENVTVDEQLLGYRGRVPGKTYMPSKPRCKYGVKIFWICEADTGYALKGFIYTGKSSEGVHRNLALDIVKDLTIPFYNSGRNIVCDNFFTSHDLAIFLLSKKLTLLGTVRSHRREIPNYIRATDGRNRFDVRSIYDHENKIMILSYIPKRKKNVIIMTSGNHDADIDDSDRHRPIVITEFYNKSKGGVDLLDQQIEEYTVRRKTNRWPLLMFFDCLDVGCYNAYIMMRSSIPSYDRKTFLKDLALGLSQSYAERRLQKCNDKLHAHIRQAAVQVGYRVPDVSVMEASQPRTTCGSCYQCKRKTRSFCDECFKPICPAHRLITKKTVCTSTCH